MKAAQRVRKEIERVISIGFVPQGVDGAALATEYAEFCRGANERLRRCRRHVDEGMVSEAMHVAETRPALLDLCAALDFPEVERWFDIAKASKWEVAESIDAASIAAINEAYDSGAALQPTIRQYRGAVQRKDFAGSVRLLRQLVKLAPQNQGWGQDLNTFELRRLEEIDQELLRADADDDLDKLEELSLECSDEWTAREAPAVKDRVESSLLRAREQAALEEGARIAEKISDSYGALDYSAVEMAILEYDRLVDEGYFRPDSAVSMQYDEACEWYGAEKEIRDKAEEFQNNLEQLKAELAKDGPAKEAEKLLNLLRATEGEIPDDLERRAVRAVANYHEMEYRRKRLLLVLCSVGAIVVAAFIASVFGYRHYTGLIAYYVPRFQQAIDQTDAKSMDLLGAEIKEHVFFGPLVHKSPQIQEMLLQNTDVETLVAQKRARFQDIVSDMRTIAKNRFIKDQRFRILHEEASRLLETVAPIGADPENSEAVDLLASARLRHWKRILGGKESELRKLTKDALARLPALDLLNTASLKEVGASLDELRDAVELGRGHVREITKMVKDTGIRGTSDLIIRNFESLQSEIAALRDGIDDRRTLLSKASRSEDLDGYCDALQDYVRRFPDDMKAPAFMKVIEKKGHYQYMMSFTSGGSAAPKQSALVGISDGIPRENYFWDALLERYVTLQRNATTKWPSIQRNLQGWKNDKLLASLCVFECRDVNAKTTFNVYCYDDLMEKVKRRDTIGTRAKRYYAGCEVYIPQPQDEQPEFSEPSVGIPVERMGEVLLLAHCKYVTNMVSRVHSVDAAEADLFLLEEITTLASHSTFLNSLLKLRLIRYFAEQFVELVESGVLPEIDAALAAMEVADDEFLQWLCTKSPLVSAASQTAEAILVEHFGSMDFIAKYKFERMLRQRCVERGVQWVGHVDFESASSLRLKQKSVNEVWTLRFASPELRVIVAAERVGGNFRVGERLELAEPIFAPALREYRGSRETVRELIKISGINGKQLAEVDWPPVWPLNRRD